MIFIKTTIFAEFNSGYYITEDNVEHHFDEEYNNTICIDTYLPFVPNKGTKIDVTGLNGKELHRSERKVKIQSVFSAKVTDVLYKVKDNTLSVWIKHE